MACTNGRLYRCSFVKLLMLGNPAIAEQRCTASGTKAVVESCKKRNSEVKGTPFAECLSAGMCFMEAVKLPSLGSFKP